MAVLVSLNRPLGDGRVDFRHEADSFAQGRDNLPVVLQIVIGRLATSEWLAAGEAEAGSAGEQPAQE